MADDIERELTPWVDAAGVREIRDWVKDTLQGDLKVVETDEVPDSPEDDTFYVVVPEEGAVAYYLCTNSVLRRIESGGGGGDGTSDYNELINRPKVDGTTLLGNKTHEDLGLIGEDDFVTEATDKADGMEFVLPATSPDNPVQLSEINDSIAFEYSSVHTSSNNKINSRFTALENAVARKLNCRFVNEMPDTPELNTQYYVATDDPTVCVVKLVDSVGEVHTLGTTELDLSDVVMESRKVAGFTLDADVTAAQIAIATQNEPANVTNKGINAQNNAISYLDTRCFDPGALAKSIDASDPQDTKLTTEKAVTDFAIRKSTSANVIYGTDSSGEGYDFTRVSAIANSATDLQIPTSKAVYGYAVPKTSTANRIYGTNSSSVAYNYALSTSVSSSSNDTQIPTAKAVYSFAVPQTNTGNRIYGTNSSGGETQYPFSDTYTSTASNQLFTRAGAHNLYSAVRNGEQAMVFCGNFTRTSTQSIGSNTAFRIPLPSADIYRTNLVQLSGNYIKILVAGTYWFRFIGRLADTAGAARAWYLGGGSTSSMADDQMGGQWNYTWNRHKAEATYLKYCGANESIAPWIYIDSNSGMLNYMTVEVFRLNNK